MLVELRPQIASIFRRYQVPRDDHEDLLQDTLLTLVAQADRIQNPPAWLIGTLRNQCFLYWRRRRRNLCEAIDSALLADLAPPTAPSQENKTLRGDLNRTIGRLPDRCRAYFRLRYSLDCDNREVARQMGYQEANVRQVGLRCLSALAQEFLGRPVTTRTLVRSSGTLSGRTNG